MIDITDYLRQMYIDHGTNRVQEAADTIERLQKERDWLMKKAQQSGREIDRLTKEVLELRSQVAALEVDAERYRWLRDVARTVDWTQYINGTAYVCHCRIGPHGMDAAIDAARKGELL